ncbi:polymeric immunoglobulin receptor-like [Salminus brasiliensis]|uniref:polymeric immunoglobulin receptor-like n=1 Tax=Salminus brasiliensis TaxID=930266 RepID=UPI003B83A48D
MTVKILLFFTLYLMSVGGGASREVAGYPGGGVLIKCKYERSYTSNKKYFCKGSWTNCADQIKTGVSNEWKNTGRFSLFDNTSAAEFWVLIRELTVEDSGTYWCAVDIEMWPDDHTPVELKIKEDRDQEKSITVNGHVGESVNISCKYPRSSSSKPKFLCRRVGSTDCNYKASVKESRRWIKEGKISLCDDRAQQTFTVSIDNLTNEDSGEYWCGAESDWESDHGYKVYITQINLRVTASVKLTPLSTMSDKLREDGHISQEIDELQQKPAMESIVNTIYAEADRNTALVYSPINGTTELTTFCTTTHP